MARYSKSHKEETKRNILIHAARRFRQDGLAAVGLRSLMTDAGLTHGGFYAHFPARDALVIEALDTALDEISGLLSRAATEGGLTGLIRAYLDPHLRDHPGLGCAAASLAPEIAREAPTTQSRFAAAVSATARLISDHLPPGGGECDRLARGRAIFAMMMGSMQLSRTEPDPATSNAILQTARDGALALAHLPWPERIN
ncbi:MAG: TetR/AcrR family transcriptional regulator [Pseudodonghicola sp.]|jgi:TetR/AcrR family transcriptional repressor of nem operon|uniref:TetR/AcrR family transcriptional regulator n=1 Tax=Pseudodonghicola sp. TaxID=1969463 RepID=UPI003A97AF0F